MKKDKFVKPEIEIYNLILDDIICTSGDYGVDGPIDGGEEGWGDMVLYG